MQITKQLLRFQEMRGQATTRELQAFQCEMLARLVDIAMGKTFPKIMVLGADFHLMDPEDMKRTMEEFGRMFFENDIAAEDLKDIGTHGLGIGKQE